MAPGAARTKQDRHSDSVACTAMFVPRRTSGRCTPQRWRATRIVGNAARHITEPEAESAEAAIKEHGITHPHQRARLGAYRVAWDGQQRVQQASQSMRKRV